MPFIWLLLVLAVVLPAQYLGMRWWARRNEERYFWEPPTWMLWWSYGGILITMSAFIPLWFATHNPRYELEGMIGFMIIFIIALVWTGPFRVKLEQRYKGDKAPN